ncbi:MAG: TldD/PmbA family protein [SAR324 cluster bacterium]|nr:TldD/PmbA family protein [SAR324 cluster bacterium]MBL7035809.1 TldD/PmbA family protein [SAR324 cluster bacterium]
MLKMKQAAEHVLMLAAKKGLKDVDVVVERSESLDVEIQEGKVEKVEQSTSLGLGIRVLDGGRTGLASTERLSSESVENAFNNACENAKLQDPTDVEMLDAPAEVPDSAAFGLYNPELDLLNAEDLSELGLSIEDAVKAADKRVVSIPYLGASRASHESMLLSSRGVFYRQQSNEVAAWCGPLLQEGDSRKSGMQIMHRREWNPDAGKRIGIEAVEKAAELLKAASISGGSMPVVLDEYMAPRFLGMFFGAFSAEAAQRGMSRLQGKLGESIAVPELTLLDDPHRVGGNRSCFLDGEGFLTKPLPLIENGVFRNFLYHVESARKDNKTSTGHAARGSSGGIGTRSHNLVWPTGDYSLQQLCELNSKCLMVTQLEGHAGCNPVSGDISIGVQGFLIENGKRIQPVDSITVAGNFFDVLKQIQGMGNTYQPELTHSFIPAMLIEGLTVSA